MTRLQRHLRSIATGVWDFLVGDSPHVVVFTLVVVGAAFALRPLHVLAVVALPLLVLLALVLSVRWGRLRAGTSRSNPRTDRRMHRVSGGPGDIG